MAPLHSMERKRGDQMAESDGSSGGDGGASSSIAILQERFRQLQKMREKREEMELLKMFSESETTLYKRSGTSLPMHPEAIYNHRIMTTRRSSYLQDSLSLGLDKTERHQPSKTPPSFRDFWFSDSVPVSTSRAHDKHDIDTSLHL